jgi:hypothetical protein
MRGILICAAQLALVSCDAKIGGNESGGAAANSQGSAEGKAEEGKIALKAPGFDISIAVPKQTTERAKSDHDSDLLYPGSAISGMYVAAGEGSGKGEVELRFTSADPPEKVAAWYRDPARQANFSVGEAKRNGSDILVEGREKGDGQTFKLRLGARDGGGTDGRLTVRDKS